MPPEESKPVEAVADEVDTKLKGKTPEVETDSEDDGPESAAPANADADAAAPSSSAGKKKKKKKSKTAKAKELLTGKSGGAQKDIIKALADLTPQQLTELMALNPALAQEVSQAAGSANPSADEAAALMRNMNLQEIMTGLAVSGKNAKDMGAYKFWQTQPVPRFGEDSSKMEEGPLRIQKVEDVPKEPAPLVPGFEWVEMDLTSDEEIKEVYELLNKHYVEDDEAMFRFNYSPSILRWAMMAPGWKKEYHVGVRASQSRKLVAFISAIPVKLRVRDKHIMCSEVNFLSIHKKLRGKRLAPVLIKEITRRSNLNEIWQGLYTAGVVLPKPVSTCRYFHRALNWQKLYECKFSPLPAGSKPAYQIRKYALPENPSTKGLRAMEEKDIDAVLALWSRYTARFEMVPSFTKEEAYHWFVPKVEPSGEQVVWTYVVEDANKNITDFFSFYNIESSVIGHPKHNVIRVAYLFYYATEVGLQQPFDKPALKKRLNELVHDALVLAKKYKFDVFNALSLMDNGLFLEQQKFGGGDGQLHYYLFNYRLSPISGGVDKKNNLDENALSGIGTVML